MRSIAAGVLLGLLLPLPALAQDTDQDGIPDAIEQTLGTNPQLPETLRLVLEDGAESAARIAAEGYNAAKDVQSVEFGHVAENRYLWKVNFAGTPEPMSTVLHLYLDADCNEATGRPGPANAYVTGTDYMLSVVGGGANPARFGADGTRSAGPSMSFAALGNSVFISSDLDLARDDQGIRFGLYVLCHDVTQPGEQPKMDDSVPKKLVSGQPIVDREKIMRPEDRTENWRITATHGLDILRALLADPDTVQVRYDQLECDGYAVDIQTQRRFGHVSRKGLGGKVTARAPKAGKYYVGFMMYDDGNDERVAVYLRGELAGLALARNDNNRDWLFYLSDPVDIAEGDEVTLVALGPSGLHGICNVLFFPRAPETRGVENKVENTLWAGVVNEPGRVNISWTTTWPGRSRFEYGTTTEYGQVAEEDCYRIVHKARLSGLDPDATYHGRAVGFARDGSPYYGPDITFDAKGIIPPETQADTARVPLTVRNQHDFALTGWPTTAGVPFPRGVLGSADNVRILRDGGEVPAQIKPTGTWPDGSVKWVLVTLLADVPASGEAVYELEFGRDVRRAAAGGPLATQDGGSVIVDTGAVRFAIDSRGQVSDLRTPEGCGFDGACSTSMSTSEGGVFSTNTGDAPAQVVIEENGPLRTVIFTARDMLAEDGGDSFRVEQRIEAWRGSPLVVIHHTFINDVGQEWTEVERMSLTVPASAQWRALVENGEPVGVSVKLQQRFDGEYTAGDAVVKGRLTGTVLPDADAACAVSLRDMWQQYPKALSATDDALQIDLCPDFDPGLYDAFPFEKEGHHLYYYLLNGRYKLRQGMAKTHELLLCPAPAETREALCQAFQRPPLLTAPPDWYCSSRAFYDVAPRNEELFQAYEQAVDKNIAEYIKGMERQHDFGMMNYGDWYGERGANWGNEEYDTQHAFLLEYIRSGNPDAFFLGHSHELHNRDIDTVQWASDPKAVGGVCIHQMGHVGGYYTESVPGTLGIPRAGYTVSHAWSEGHFDHYFLTGDPRSRETGVAVTDFFADKSLGRPYDFASCRDPGWHLIMNAAALAATNDPYYLNASRAIVDRVLETQDTVPRPLPEYQREPGRTHQLGGWSRMMVPGHCLCEPRHQGNAGFMVAVLLSGLKYYHDVTEDPAVKQAIILGARNLIEETYSEEVHGFRYTSCPATRYVPGASPLMVEGIARAYMWTRDPMLLDSITTALSLGAGGSGYGKSFSMYYRCAPRVLADLAACGLTLEERMTLPKAEFKAPDWLAALPENRRIVLQAEKFTGQGGGEVAEKDDRQGCWGTMITQWHADIGHWLEWEFEVPEDAEYRICFRYASGSENAPRRKVEIDGNLPTEAAESVTFPLTGGYASAASDWKYEWLRDGAGQDVRVPLTAGKHRLRMTNLGDGMGLDFVVLVRD